MAIELEDGIERGIVAIDRAAAGGAGSAAFVGPDVAVFRIDVDAGGGAPLAALGSWPQLRVTFGAGFGNPSPVIGFPTLVCDESVTPTAQTVRAANSMRGIVVI